jgi:tetratricopeptide (TPR) repeat protein
LAKLDAAIAVSSDVRLRFDRGDVLKRMGQYDRAKPELEAALAIAPKHPFASTAWFDLAICAGKQGHHADEETAYLACLALSLDDAERAIAWSNLGESWMAVARLDDAARAFETAIALRPQTLPFTWWNLAVARDRQDDEAAAMRVAKIALSLDAGGASLVGPDVFFEPPYERWWYGAIVALAEADQASDAPTRRECLAEAEAFYRQWATEAPATAAYRGTAVERAKELGARVAAVRGK